MSFAKDNWEEFEKLSLSILETYLPTDSEFSYSITHTPHRKDGGYDGIFLISSKMSTSSTRIFEKLENLRIRFWVSIE